jgi:AcrR family transcriptional regulator
VPPSAAAKTKSAKIAKAALAVFSQHGYGRATVDRIAGRAKVGKGTIYEYYDSKEELFLAAVRLAFDRLGAAAVDEANRDRPAAERLSQLGESVLGEMKGFFGLMMEAWSAAGTGRMGDRLKGRFRDEYARHTDLVVGIIETGQSRGEFSAQVDARAVGRWLVGAWDGLLFRNWLWPDFDPVDHHRRAMSALLSGLTPAEP